MQEKSLLSQLKFSRLETLRALVTWPISHILGSYARKYLNEGRRQLVVFSFDSIAQQINLHGLYERKELEIFFLWAKKDRSYIFDGIAVDIGANIGNHSLYFSDLFKHVISFEPNIRTFQVLELNANLANNITTYNFGISNTEREAVLNINPSNIGGSYLSESASSTSQVVKLRRLDSVISDDQRITMIKIDVEGHEYEALTGARNVIERNKPLILFEQHKTDFHNGKSRVIELLRGYGYTNFGIIERYPRPFAAIPKAIQPPVELLLRIVFGQYIKLSVQKTIVPDFYSFVAALPDKAQ